MSDTSKTQGKQRVKNKGQFPKGHHPKTEWKKGGPSPNPKGRRDAISDILRRILDEDDGAIKKVLARKLIDNAVLYEADDFLKALDRIMDRTEGKPQQTITQKNVNIDHGEWDEQEETAEEFLSRELSKK